MEQLVFFGIGAIALAVAICLDPSVKGQLRMIKQIRHAKRVYLPDDSNIPEPTPVLIPAEGENSRKSTRSAKRRKRRKGLRDKESVSN